MFLLVIKCIFLIWKILLQNTMETMYRLSEASNMLQNSENTFLWEFFSPCKCKDQMPLSRLVTSLFFKWNQKTYDWHWFQNNCQNWLVNYKILYFSHFHVCFTLPILSSKLSAFYDNFSWQLGNTWPLELYVLSSLYIFFSK